MTQAPRKAPVEPMPLIAERVAAIRRYRDLTQEQVAEAMRELGIEWQRITVAKIEGNRRAYLTVAELLAICIVLEISPVDLLVPRELKDDQPYLVTPNRTARAEDVSEWVRGEDGLFTSEHPGREPIMTGKMRLYEATGRFSDPTQWMPAERAHRVTERIRYLGDPEGYVPEEPGDQDR